MSNFTILFAAHLAREPIFTDLAISGVSFIPVDDLQSKHGDMLIIDDNVTLESVLNFNRSFSNVPIVIITDENRTVRSLDKFSAIPLVHFIPRPFSAETTNHIIRHYQNRHEVAQQNQAAFERARAETDALAYSISHDLMAPVRAINGYSKILSEEIGDDATEHASQMLSRLQANSTKLGNMITSILEYARIGTHELHLQPVNMNDLARHALNINMPKMPISSTISDLLSVSGDSELLQQLWIHLISNAVKFSSGNANPQITIGSRPTESGVLYFVTDNGVGFNMQYADRLFKAFQRLHSVSDFAGLGMGLALAGKIAGRHGGKAWVESEINVGTTAYFELPCNSS